MATEFLNRAISLNPFQWSSFEALSRTKEDISARDTFFRSIWKSSQVESSLSSEDAVVVISDAGGSVKQQHHPHDVKDEDEEMPLSGPLSSGMLLLTTTTTTAVPSPLSVISTRKPVVRSDKNNNGKTLSYFSSICFRN